MSEEQGARLPLKPLDGTTYTWEQVREQARRAFLAGWDGHGKALAAERSGQVWIWHEKRHGEAEDWVATWLPSDGVRRSDRSPLGRVETLERRLDALERTTAEGLAARAMAHEVDAMGVAFERRLAELESRVLAASQALGGGA